MQDRKSTDEPLSDGSRALDGLRVDLDTLREWASEETIERGIASYKDQCVMEVDWDELEIRGTVEDAEQQAAVWVSVTLDAQEKLRADCECDTDEPLCEHAVASLLAWEAAQPAGDSAVETAADQAVAERIRRGKREVEVEHVSGDGIFGRWKANTVSTDRPTSRPYRVEIRSLDTRANRCECPDFAHNRLGTCKHIEAVLHQIRKQEGLDEEAEDLPQPEQAVVHVAWDVADAPRIRVERPPSLPEDVERTLDSYLDERGLLRQPTVETFNDLARRMRDESSVHVGDEARDHVERLAEDALQHQRAAEIRSEILRTDGRLEGFEATLYPYQVEGTAFLAARGRAILADDMGLGKTIQALAAATWLSQNEGVRRTLVVCPASLKHQWAREIEKFTDFDTTVIEGRPDARIVQYKKQSAFAIINYELVLRDWEEINRLYGADLLILDEAQRIKNWRTKTADTIKALETRFAFVLSGTPLENRLEDLYSIMQVVDGRVLGPLWRFMIDFHILDQNDTVIGYRNLSELRRRLEPVMLRRDRREVRDQLPERVQHRLDVEMTGRQRTLHNEALSAARRFSQIRQRRPLTPTERNRLMACLQRARMACNAAGMVDKESEGAPKLDELEELLQELCVEGGRKVVVFSEWKMMTTRVVERAREMGLGVIHLSGDVPTSKRGDLLERFENDPAAQVFVSTDAGGTGLNLQSASALINLDMPWNPAVLEQRIARVHRLGQTESVQVILMLSANSYEERVAGLVGTKQHLFDQVVSPDATQEVVGLTKKALEWIEESLDDVEALEGDEETDGAAQTSDDELGQIDEPSGGEGDAAVLADIQHRGVDEEDRAEDRTNEIVALVQQRLGDRIEQILAVAAGFAVIVDRVDDFADAVAEAASTDEIAVTVLEQKTVSRLEKLGARSPFSDATRVDTPAEGDVGDEEPRATASRAERRLRAAWVLYEQGLAKDALEIAAEAICSAIAERAGVKPPRRAENATAWLHTEALPGLKNGVDAHLATRLVAVSTSSEVPGPLAEELLEDADHILEALSGGWATSSNWT